MNKLSLAQQSFLFQYLSLILIVLAFLIATTRPKHSAVSIKPVNKSNISLNALGLNSEILLDSTFLDQPELANPQIFLPLKELLLNHNLDIHFLIETPVNPDRKAMALGKILGEQGFWQDSYTITSKENSSANRTELKAKFVWSEL